MRKAFTFLELIFVIVVLGIVASITSEILAKMFDGYIVSRTYNRLQTKTEFAVQQVAQRLSYRIPNTAIAKNTGGGYVPLRSATGNEDILEWIGRDFEGFRGNWDTLANRYLPLWSGFIDLDNAATTQSQFFSTVTKPLSLHNRLQTLSNNQVGLTVATQNPAIFFKGRLDDTQIAQYWNSTVSDYAYPVQCSGVCSDANSVLAFRENFNDANPGTLDLRMYEQYYLSYSAYAIVPAGNGVWDLYYNYQPWENETYQNGTRVRLIDGVSTFRFKQVGDVVRLKLCATEHNGDQNITVCKEKAIL